MNDLFGEEEFSQIFEVNSYQLAGVSLKVREFSFHRLNGNQVWPGNQIFADFLIERLEEIKGKRVLELGSGSGILSIFLRKLNVDITASDCPDQEVAENIKFNAENNGIEDLKFLPHMWGEELELEKGFELILASDILIYLKSFGNLIKTLEFLLKDGAVFWLNNRRRIETEEVFLGMCLQNGFTVKEIYPKVFEIKKVV